MSEKELEAIEKSKSGDAKAFSVLYDGYIRKIYSFVYYRIQHKETAEDITSTVFLKALKGIRTYDEQKAEFSTWLYAIARNALTDHFRSTYTTSDIEDVWDALRSDEDVERDTEVRLKLEEVEQYLTGLDAEIRELIVMRLWDGLGYREISTLTGKTEGACKMAFSRAMRELRGKMPLAAFIALITTTL